MRIAAIGFLNPAPLMWDFEHPPLDAVLANRYLIDRMTPAECAERLADGRADIGLIPIASLATMPALKPAPGPGLRILPGCTIASKGRVRSLLLVHRASQPLSSLGSVAADTASRTTLAYARIMLAKWGNAEAPFVPMAADLDRMLQRADAAILIGDPALLALEERNNRFERTGEELVYLDMAEQWRALTGLAFVSAVWGTACGSLSEQSIGEGASRSQRGSLLDESMGGEAPRLHGRGFSDAEIAEDLIRSRDHGLENIDALVAEWSARMPIPEDTIRSYLTDNIHYVLDEECIEGMQGFFRLAAEYGVLPPYTVAVEELAAR